VFIPILSGFKHVTSPCYFSITSDKVLVFVFKLFHCLILLSVEVTSLLMSAGDTGLHCPLFNFRTSTSHRFVGYPSHWEAS